MPYNKTTHTHTQKTDAGNGIYFILGSFFGATALFLIVACICHSKTREFCVECCNKRRKNNKNYALNQQTTTVAQITTMNKLNIQNSAPIKKREPPPSSQRRQRPAPPRDTAELPNEKEVTPSITP